MFSLVLLVVKIILRLVYVNNLVCLHVYFVNFADFIFSAINLSFSGSDF